MTEDSINFLQVGPAIECGHCHPGKYAIGHLECNCICHDDNNMDWEMELGKLLDKILQQGNVFRDSMNILEYVQGLLSSQEHRLNTLAQQKCIAENLLTRERTIDECINTLTKEGLNPHTMYSDLMRSLIALKKEEPTNNKEVNG